MPAERPAWVPGLCTLAAALLAGGCGGPPAAGPAAGPGAAAPAPPDLLARPAGFELWDYWPTEDPHPSGLSGPGGTLTGRVKVIARWPQYFDLRVVHREEYDRVRAGMAYAEVRDIVGGALLPYKFDPDSEYDLCLVQGDRVALFRFRGGTLVGKDERGID